MRIICDWEPLGLCLVKAGSSTETIFGFSEFLSGFALLVIVYTITDFKYKFRVSVAPINLNIMTFIFIIFIGMGTLLSQLWVAKEWPTFVWNFSQVVWQSIFAFLFLFIISLWIWFAFISPPKFSKNNYKIFSKKVYRAVLRGDVYELNVISEELNYSLPMLIHHSNNRNKDNIDKHDISLYAEDMVLLLANRRFCKSLAISSPSTILCIFDTLSKSNVVNSSSISILIANLSSELITNKESQLYHEDEGYKSGLLGYIKPLSKSVYGNFRLVEDLSSKGRSPFDVDYKVKDNWDDEQLKVFCQAVTICFESYIEQGCWYQHSFTLYRAFDDIKGFIPNLYELNGSNISLLNSQIINKFQVILDFLRGLIDVIDGQNNAPICFQLRNKSLQSQDMYCKIATLYTECIHAAAYVSNPVDTCWFIQHNLVWSELFDNNNEQSKAQKIIMHKVRRNVYDNILKFGQYPNYRTARYIGFCLNVLWIKSHVVHKKDIGWALRKVVVAWVKQNYLTLFETNRVIAEACLHGGLSFDEEKKAIIKTFQSFTPGKLSEDYFYLINEQ
ncbi:hypothetical protein [Aliivibrio fischeri]|uniref:hypothetical protein n=1 Tax=Aliivibrio fischeri TaxID=668 RepID=UPI0012DA7E7C|nr:hypothetical protein [Aliivibrio fischeri]MUK70254.1 hypothetical protein [Aliivibrio fischeri]MUK72082.1 hypothetical protein [Aliivibrio fischeri]